MTHDEQRLVRHLVTAVLVKLAVLVGLWCLFVRDARVDVGTEEAAEQIGVAKPIPQGGARSDL